MSDDVNYQNNPLHGIGLKQLLNILVDHYGFEILNAYLDFNCFKNNPSVESSLKFLKKTDWAREKLESFYLYQYKSLPLPPKHELEISPRDRIIPEDQQVGEPAELSFTDAKQHRRDEAKPKRSRDSKSFTTKPAANKPRRNNAKTDQSASAKVDPWAKWR